MSDPQGQGEELVPETVRTGKQTGFAVEGAYRILPRMIDVRQSFFGAFNNRETEMSARWIVRLMQEKNCWAPFTRKDIETLYHQEHPGRPFRFNRLVQSSGAFSRTTGVYENGGGWVVLDSEERYRVTDVFITQCFSVAPLEVK